MFVLSRIEGVKENAKKKMYTYQTVKGSILAFALVISSIKIL